MSQLGKLLKHYAGWLALILVLLVVQAFCDLALPDYTSNIVNVGIQQGGVESAAPEEIRASEFQKIITLTSKENQELIKESYYLTEDGKEISWDQSFEQITSDDRYHFVLKGSADLERLEPVIGRSIMAVSMIDSDSEQAKAMQSAMREKLPEEMKNIPMMDLFLQLPEEQLAPIVSQIDEQLREVPDSIVSQSAISYVKNEYSAIGRDVEQIQKNYIWMTGLKMLGVALVAMVCTIAVTFLASRIAAGYSRDLRSGAFKKVLSFSSKEMDHFSTASLITRCTNDIQQIQMLLVMMCRMVFYAPIIGIGALIKLSSKGSSMTWVIGLAVVVIMSIVLMLFTFVMPKFKVLQKMVDKVNLIAREILTGLPVIRAFSTQKHEEKRFDDANRDLTKTNLFVNRVMTCMMPTMMFVMNGVSVLIIWVGAGKVDAGVMQVGDLMAFIQYAMQIIMAFLMISMMSIMLPRAWVSVRRLGEIYSEPLSIHDPETPQQPMEEKKGWVEFKNVSFRYPNAEEDVLSNITFTAKPGETVALIGSTGSGKSTLLNLIPRFFDVTEGELLVDGVDVRELSQHELRAKLGYVPQKAVLFSGTIRSNISYGNEQATDEEVVKAAEIAQSAEFIDEKPEGYDSAISQGGGNVSGGQKQRLSIARAIATKPEIYLFDDSFSALDFKTDVTLRKALRTATKDSTILIVAQRISTVINADQILVLDEGRIVGKGTHKELLKNCEVYQQIALSQLSKEELDHE
ncbi:ABC transporter ATP-binding protein [Massiliimalia massiliensis]|uniref:ABC transporter ATP-binding protein n=1 Tax=Massiliimalia massiliensis TaxID=1852384 RepID=UPI00098522EC|nr:ABC transporter ATP-binding protein [Massiliimalia massiliensis]